MPGAALAENGGTQYKIGVVDFRAVFEGYNKKVEAYTNLNQLRDEMQDPLDEMFEQISKDREVYQAESETMDPDDRSALQEKIESALSRYNAEKERSQEDIDRQERKLVREIFEDIQQAVQEVGAQNNYHLIFDSGEDAATNLPGRAGGLLYHSTTINMTQRVIDHLNKEQQ